MQLVVVRFRRQVSLAISKSNIIIRVVGEGIQKEILQRLRWLNMISIVSTTLKNTGPKKIETLKNQFKILQNEVSFRFDSPLYDEYLRFSSPLTICFSISFRKSGTANEEVCIPDLDL